MTIPGVPGIPPAEPDRPDETPLPDVADTPAWLERIQACGSRADIRRLEERARAARLVFGPLQGPILARAMMERMNAITAEEREA